MTRSRLVTGKQVICGEGGRGGGLKKFGAGVVWRCLFSRARRSGGTYILLCLDKPPADQPARPRGCYYDLGHPTEMRHVSDNVILFFK